MDGLQKDKEDNPLWKQCLIQHNGNKAKFKMTCLKSFKTAFMRQVNKGVRIACCGAEICELKNAIQPTSHRESNCNTG